MKKILFLAFGLAAAFSSSATLAQDRYRERPPVVVSPDLAAPWVMQLAGPNGRPVVYPRQAAQPRPVYQQREAYQQREQQPMVRRGIFDRSPAQPVAMRPQPIRGQIEPQFLPQTVAYDSKEKAGTIVIDTNNRFLYLVTGNGQARRYGVGVGKPGFEWAGEHRVTRKSEWPDWTPPSEMIQREAVKGHYLPARMDGGPENPLGARAMYLGSTLYRIHGTNAPWTIGSAVSSGCIRMRNEDVTDLYERVNIGTKVIVM
ncbi:ErfK/YbiS/YcfS/YnhG family protein [Neorhizobium galegae bv. officinalis bv. officinalis str. HAMBI 1141]|uniref:ErfK/YbiS/YcfS/YnhG family protein n=2 Tax=Neorhizobium galegae TaxID=399 RepID=A0A068T3X7_NEOGA|nr:ErfK/YbiS/YcfS/YnhG family protein [Neorhizobium galegae bv. officinalis bv. officinalis str. HAMBI 1141]